MDLKRILFGILATFVCLQPILLCAGSDGSNVTAAIVTSTCSSSWTQHAGSCFCIENTPGGIVPCAHSLASLQAAGASIAAHISLAGLQEASRTSAALNSYSGLVLAVFADSSGAYSKETLCLVFVSLLRQMNAMYMCGDSMQLLAAELLSPPPPSQLEPFAGAPAAL